MELAEKACWDLTTFGLENNEKINNLIDYKLFIFYLVTFSTGRAITVHMGVGGGGGERGAL